MTDIDDKNVEASALCEQMENLNIVDQDAAENTVLGNTAILEGHANFNVTTKLEELASRIGEIEMKLELGNVIDHDFEAYRLAREQNSKYVSHHSFTVGFLRAELYDTKNAAWRMFRYLRIKLDLFGIDKLTQDILIDDLGEDGKRYLARGGLQVLPQRDTSGRRVVFGTGVLNGSGNASDVIGAVSVPCGVCILTCFYLIDSLDSNPAFRFPAFFGSNVPLIYSFLNRERPTFISGRLLVKTTPRKAGSRALPGFFGEFINLRCRTWPLRKPFVKYGLLHH